MAKQSQCNRLVLQEIGSISGGENDELIRVAEAWPFNSRGRDGVVTNPLCAARTHTRATGRVVGPSCGDGAHGGHGTSVVHDAEFLF